MHGAAGLFTRSAEVAREMTPAAADRLQRLPDVAQEASAVMTGPARLDLAVVRDSVSEVALDRAKIVLYARM